MIRRLENLPIAVLAANGILALAMAWFVLDRDFSFPAILPPPGAPAHPKAAPVEAAEQTTLAAYRERPLFSANRRMATAEEIAAAEAAEAAAAEPPPPKLTGYRLTGTLIGAGRKIAFVQQEGNSRAKSITVGGSVDDWQLVELELRQATFELQGNRTVLDLVKVSETAASGGKDSRAGDQATEAPKPETVPRKSNGPRKTSKARLYRPPKGQ